MFATRSMQATGQGTLTGVKEPSLMCILKDKPDRVGMQLGNFGILLGCCELAILLE